MSRVPILALTQGDPAGVGPEILLKAAATSAAPADRRYLLIAERRALEAVAKRVPGFEPERLQALAGTPSREDLEALEAGRVALLDPVGDGPALEPGRSGPAEAGGALAALDAGIELARAGAVDALVTAPVSKESIARHCLPEFRGHTDHLAAACGLERYGRDYLMAFLSEDLQVALLSTHLPLAEALARVEAERIEEALVCLDRHAGGRIAVAGLNPHAGEGGLIGNEEEREVAPAVERARRRGIDAHGPESPDSLFARARRGEFDWVLALYHDQGLIAVKTSAFGAAVNWTLGLPFVRTSVDHGTAFAIAGSGEADAAPLELAAATAVQIATRGLPRLSR